MSLQEYRRKRDFRKTREPAAGRHKTSGYRFVVQKHAASRLHYDFRLEMGGTLRSWAVPKGIPFKHGEKRLAVQVEDHPVTYIDFEGCIPKGQYGGGTVMVWDTGTFEPLSKAPAGDLSGGKLHFILHGGKLEGEWYLVRLREENQWLLIRGGSSMKAVSKKSDDQSALSGKSMKELSRGDNIRRLQPAKKRGQISPPRFVEPMQAKLVASPPTGNWIFEIKFDGWRALALKGEDTSRLVSRKETDFSRKFPEIMDSLAELRVRDAIVDGEIVALDKSGISSFQLLQAYDLGQVRPPLFYYAFDLLRCDGKDLRELPLLKRKAQLEKLLKNSSGVIRYSASLGKDAKPLLLQARKVGLEGLIGKKSDSAYEAGRRSGAWIKLKIQSEQEFVIGGYTDPEGSRKHFGSLIVGYHKDSDFLCAGKVGTGFNEKLLASLSASFLKISRSRCPFDNLPAERSGRWGQGITAAEMKHCHWLKPQLVCQVRFTEWTRDGRLRHPVFLGLRKDKRASEVAREKAT